VSCKPPPVFLAQKVFFCSQAARIYVGGIDPKLQERDLEDEVITPSASAEEGLPVDSCIMQRTGLEIKSEFLAQFIRFGTLRSVWVARKPPGFGTLPLRGTQFPCLLPLTF